MSNLFSSLFPDVDSIYCPDCNKFLDENGDCPNGCNIVEVDESEIYDDDLYDVIPGRDYAIFEDNTDEY